jgi:hypothetical protein
MFAQLLLSMTAVLPTAQGSSVAAENQAAEPQVRSLQYLADFVATAPTDEELGQGAANASAKRMAALTFIGAVLDAHPNEPRFDQIRADVYEQVEKGALPQGATGGFTGWMHPFATFYLVEHALQTETKVDLKLLQALVEGIEGSQNVEGGWGHSAGDMASFYPSTLVATTNLNLIALGLAKSMGAEISQESVDDGFELLATVQGANGGMPYGGPAYRKGYEAGRTAASMLAYAAHGRMEGEQYKKASQYVAQNLKYIPLGHASTAMHLYFGGLAAQLMSAELQQEFEDSVLSRIRKAYTADGSFDDVVDHSPDTMLAFNDKGKIVDRAYVSALSLGALQADRCMWVQRLVPNPLTAAITPAQPSLLELPTASWQNPVKDIDQVVVYHDQIAACTDMGELNWYFKADGKARASLPAPALSEGLAREIKFVQSGDLLLQTLTDNSESEASPFDENAEEIPPGEFHLRRITPQGVVWSRNFKNASSRIRPLGNELHMLFSNGGYMVLDASNGETKRSWSAGSTLLNAGLAPHADGTVTISVENKVQHLEEDGWEVWTKRTSGQQGITPPAWTALLADGDRLLLGESRGEVQCRKMENGKGVWRNMLGGSIRSMSKLASIAGHILVVSSDGRVHAINTADGSTRWSTLFSYGDESNQALKIVQDKGYVWLHHPEVGRLLKINADDGEVVGLVELDQGSTWTLRGGQLYLVKDGGLMSISL